MNHQRIHRFCLALMLSAMLVRLAGQVQAYLDWKHSLAPTLWRVDIDAAPTELVCRTPLPAGLSPVSSAAPEAAEPSGELPAASEEDAVPEEPSQNAPAEPSETLTFSPEEADAIVITGGCTYTYEKQALLMQPSTLDFSGDGPKILIVHTHATESYLPSSEGNYHRKGRLNTVRDAGDVLAETLDKEGKK